MSVIDEDHPVITNAVSGIGPHSRAVRDVVAAVLRRHAQTHALMPLTECIDHDPHEDIARALMAFGLTREPRSWS